MFDGFSRHINLCLFNADSRIYVYNLSVNGLQFTLILNNPVVIWLQTEIRFQVLLYNTNDST